MTTSLEHSPPSASRPDLGQARAEGLVITPYHLRQARMVWSHPRLACVIYGETGTGKEEVAKLIHRKRCAVSGAIPFVPVNCANLNGDLADSLLFGHTKGSFSGADRTTPGLIGEADGGVLFLDEVHTLSLQTQYKLLRVLNDGSYTRVGSSTVSRATFQVIAASTRDLDTEVDERRFLLDLRSRLLGVDIHLPPLRERTAEMPLFVHLFFERTGVAIDPGELAAIVDRCSRYYWRGNVRQLYKVLQSLVIIAACNDVPIRAADLPEFRTMLPPGADEAPLDAAASSFSSSAPAAPATPPEPDAATTTTDSPGMAALRRGLTEDMPLRDVLDAVERELLAAAMRRHPRIRDAYAGLGIGRNTFDVKRRKHGLKRP
jgi:DNA-binding NtrC family response regulator